MRSLALKLLALLAYMAMPFTMSAAMSATAPSHHDPAIAMANTHGMEHCPAQGTPGVDHTAFVGCAMMCTALPNAEIGENVPIELEAARPAPLQLRTYSGIYLEIATPPPRLT